METKFSIIIPIYNSENTLKRCLESIINQKYKSFEIILIDDGSTDSSSNICDIYSNLDKRIKVFHTSNHGVSHARNIGLKNSTGEYIQFIDSDDYIDKLMLSKINAILEEERFDVIITGITLVKQNRESEILYPRKQGRCNVIEFWKSFYDEQMSNGLYGYISNKVYKRDIISKNGILFDEKIISQEDYEFALRVYSKSNKFFFLNESYYYYIQSEYHRDGNILTYLQNHIKLREILYKNNCFTDEDANLFNINIQHGLYGYVFNNKNLKYLDFIKKNSEIYKINNINKYMMEIIPEKKEIVFIIKCIINRKNRLLYIYLFFRNKICKFIKGNNQYDM